MFPPVMTAFWLPAAVSTPPLSEIICVLLRRQLAYPGIHEGMHMAAVHMICLIKLFSQYHLLQHTEAGDMVAGYIMTIQFLPLLGPGGLLFAAR